MYTSHIYLHICIHAAGHPKKLSRQKKLPAAWQRGIVHHLCGAGRAPWHRRGAAATRLTAILK